MRADLKNNRLKVPQSDRLAVLIPIAIGAFVRLVNIGGEAFWYDEAFTAAVAKLPFQNIIPAISGDFHPPTWYFLSWIVGRVFGFGEIALRIPAAIFSILSIWLIWRIGRALDLSRQTAWIAALLAAVLPAAIYYGQEARAYAFLAFAVLLMLDGALRRNWALFALGGIGCVYAHNIGAFYVAAVGGALILRAIVQRDRGLFIRSVGCSALVGIAWLPWLVGTLRQAQALSGGYWVAPVSFGSAISPYMQLSMGTRADTFILAILWLVAAGATGAGLIAARGWILRIDRLPFVAALVGAPLLAAIISILWRSFYVPRAFLPSAILQAVLWACALTAFARANRRAVAFALAPALIIGVIAHYFPAIGREELRGSLAPVAQGWQPGDVLYYTAIPPAIIGAYYLPDKPYRLDRDAGDLNQMLNPDSKRAFGFPEAAFDQLAGLGYKRAWVLVTFTARSRGAEVELARRIVKPGTFIANFDRDDAGEIWLVPLAPP